MSSSTSTTIEDSTSQALALQPHNAVELPHEMLSRIFCEVIHIDADEYGRTIYRSDLRPWKVAIWLCLVCRAWRIAALNTRFLWSYVFSPSPQFRAKALCRSGIAPLMVALTNPYRGQLRATLMSEHSRLRELVVYFPYNSPDTPFQTLILPDMPILTSISLLDTGATYAFDPKWLSVVLSQLLHASMPALQHLVLQNFPLPTSEVPKLPRVQYFSCTMDDRSAVLQIDFVRALPKFLASMPNIRYLSVYMKGFARQATYHSTNPICLSRLTTIELDMSVLHCAQFLTHIRIPNIRKERYSLHYELEGQHQGWYDDGMLVMSRIITEIGLDIASSTRRYFSHAYLYEGAERTLEFKVWNISSGDLLHGDLPEGCPIHISIEQLAYGSDDE